ncbi:hypothetical protein B0T14DRAFT_508179 [Immersiella caudata]|uniref:Cellobiose dehydrogenase-like cytochrome domain-containing protein n=1 Tax=Immersiella caudata TaxID=314043 RepID=A0AA39XHA4_9PEZI|nr:hypothetical protein B0T14DRAFT_508179 [Immersiella caudata]
MGALPAAETLFSRPRYTSTHPRSSAQTSNMKLLTPALLALASMSSLVQSQAQNQARPLSSFTDSSANITFKLAIPDTTSAPFPLLMSIIAPIGISWAGFATGGCMLRSPLIVAWPKANGTGFVVTTRWAAHFHAPIPYLNTTLSLLPSSSVNATHWKADFICSQGCSDWWGGSIDPNYNNATFGYGASSRPISSPANVTGGIPFHNVVIGHFDFDLTKAKRGVGEWEGLVKGGL